MTYISDLVDDSTPVDSDKLYTFISEIKAIKRAVRDSLPNVKGKVNLTAAELNYVDGVTSAIQTQIDAIAADIAAENAQRTKIGVVYIDYVSQSNITVRVPDGWSYTYSSSTGPIYEIQFPQSLYVGQVVDSWYGVKLSCSDNNGSLDIMPRLLEKHIDRFLFTMAYTGGASKSGKIGNGLPYKAWALVRYDG